jgi:hypothetical protein
VFPLGIGELSFLNWASGTLGSMRIDYAANPEQLIHDIATKMRGANLKWDGPNTDWTRQLKLSLRELLQSKEGNETEVLYSRTDENIHEFLLDVVVWDRSSGEGVILAVESEWTQGIEAIVEDFWKLMVIKSPLKLMVFGLNDKAWTHSQKAVWGKLKECLELYRDHQEGERYVFMDFARTERRGWWFEVPVNGLLKPVPEPQYVAFV